MRKVQSRFRRLVGVEAQKGIDFEGFRWEVGRGEEYPLTLQDLVYFYPLVVKAMANRSEVSVSLPAEAYLKNPELVKALAGRIWEHTGVKATVFPQGVVALHYLYGQGVVPYGQRVLVVDGGFNTVNLSVVSDGEVVFTRTFYNELGVRDLLDRYFREELLRRLPEVGANLQRLLDAFLEGYVDVGFTRYDLTDIKRVSTHIYLEQLFSRVKGELSRVGEKFDFFVAVGGLSYLLHGIEIDTNKGYYIPKEGGEFLTAAGMHMASSVPAIDFGFGHIKLVEGGDV